MSEAGISVDSNKVIAMKEYKQPTSMPKICSFLGLARYYYRFIEIFSIIVVPLTKLTQKNVKFFWVEDSEKVFCELKH